MHTPCNYLSDKNTEPWTPFLVGTISTPKIISVLMSSITNSLSVFEFCVRGIIYYMLFWVLLISLNICVRIIHVVSMFFYLAENNSIEWIYYCIIYFFNSWWMFGLFLVSDIMSKSAINLVTVRAWFMSVVVCLGVESSGNGFTFLLSRCC